MTGHDRRDGCIKVINNRYAQLIGNSKANCSWAEHLTGVTFTEGDTAPPRGLTGKVLKRQIRDSLARADTPSVAPEVAAAAATAPARDMANA